MYSCLFLGYACDWYSCYKSKLDSIAYHEVNKLLHSIQTAMYFTGDRCQLPPIVNPEVVCGNVVCLNGGVCAIVEQGTFQTRCFCEPGYSGPTCENRDFCALNPCKGRGNCINTTTSFYCNCIPPYAGGYSIPFFARFLWHFLSLNYM